MQRSGGSDGKHESRSVQIQLFVLPECFTPYYTITMHDQLEPYSPDFALILGHTSNAFLSGIEAPHHDDRGVLCLHCVLTVVQYHYTTYDMLLP